MHLRWRTPPGNQQGQFRGYAGRPAGSPRFGLSGTVPDPERGRSAAVIVRAGGQRDRAPGRARAPRIRAAFPSAPLPPPAPGTASPGGTHLLAVDLNGRTGQRTRPARCPADHGRAIRLTPQSSDPADTRNPASDLAHPRRLVWAALGPDRALRVACRCQPASSSAHAAGAPSRGSVRLLDNVLDCPGQQ